jgi:hypothetical protein
MRARWAARATEAEPPAPVDDEAAASHPFELAAVDLTTVEGRFSGWIATDGERTSDWLNHNTDLVVHGMTPAPPSDELVDPGLPAGDGLERRHLRPEEVVFVVPPPLPPNRHLRLHRRKVRIHLDLGGYRVSGQLHVRPGASAGDYVLRSSRRMVPLTEVELVHRGEPAFRRQLAVLIVNARHVTRMQEAEQRGQALVSASAPGPAPVAERTAAPTAPPAKAVRLVTPSPAVPTDAMAALQLLLEMGLLDITEFQVKRAQLLAQPSS